MDVALVLRQNKQIKIEVRDGIICWDCDLSVSDPFSAWSEADTNEQVEETTRREARDD
jgi:hypothetical protein